MQRIVRRIVLGLVLLSVGLTAGVYWLGPWMARSLLAAGGSYLAGVDVSVGSVVLAPRWWQPGRPAVVHLNEVRLANPRGFESPQFLTVRQVTLVLDRPSLVGDTVRVKRLVLDGLSLNLERDRLSSNAGVVLGHLSRLDARPVRFWEPARQFEVQEFELHRGEARILYAPHLGTRGQLRVLLGDRTLPPVGDEFGGVGGAELLYTLVEGVVSMAIEQVLDREPGPTHAL